MTALAWLFLAAAILLAVLLVIALAGDADLAERLRKSKAREAFLLDELDRAIENTGQALEKVAWWQERTSVWRRRTFAAIAETEQLEREALPKAPNWGAPPAEWQQQSTGRTPLYLRGLP